MSIKNIFILTVNSESLDILANALSKIVLSIKDGEKEGIGNGCKWWIIEKKIDE